LRIKSGGFATRALRGDFRTITKQKIFARRFNMIRSVWRKSGICSLDNALHFAALTRAHAGLGELRPPRCRSRNSPRERSSTEANASLLALGETALRTRGRANIHKTRKGSQVSVTGKVKFFNEVKGYGFFSRDDGSGDVFVHRTDLPAEVGFLHEGQAVRFDVEKTRRGLRAVNIALA
jgi:cold shock protein